MNPSDEKPRPIRTFLGNPAFHVLLAVLGLVAIPVVIIGGSLVVVVVGLSREDSVRPRPVSDPIVYFENITGLSCPRPTQVLFSEDTHGGMHGDGTLTVGLQVEKRVIRGWLLKVPPPLWAEEWRNGPICDKLNDRVSLELGKSPDVRYVAKDRNFDGEWRNGTLLVLDPKTGEAWLFVWDT